MNICVIGLVAESQIGKSEIRNQKYIDVSRYDFLGELEIIFDDTAVVSCI
jgi:hypothetical protein